jgi:hypothetical protein
MSQCAEERRGHAGIEDQSGWKLQQQSAKPIPQVMDGMQEWIQQRGGAAQAEFVTDGLRHLH